MIFFLNFGKYILGQTYTDTEIQEKGGMRADGGGAGTPRGGSGAGILGADQPESGARRGLAADCGKPGSISAGGNEGDGGHGGPVHRGLGHLSFHGRKHGVRAPGDGAGAAVAGPGRGGSERIRELFHDAQRL